MQIELLCCCVGPQRYGFLARQVESIVRVRVGEITPVPFRRTTLPLWVTLARIKRLDEVLPVINLADKLGLPGGETAAGSLLVVNAAGLRVALAVSEAERIVAADGQQLHLLPGWLLPPLRTCWACYCAPDGNLMPMLDPDQMFTASEQASINRMLELQLQGTAR